MAGRRRDLVVDNRDCFEQVKRYQLLFPDELAIVLSSPGYQAQKDHLDLLLLEFRKLREGIIASGRKDAFAIEVYETSAKLAILGRNTPQIGTILPHLVRSLHWPTDAGPLHPTGAASSETLAGQMSKLMVEARPSSLPTTPLVTRARFASYYLLHTLLGMRDRAAFSRVLGDLVNFSAAPASVRIPHAQPHIAFVLRMFQLELAGDYAAFSKVIAEPSKYDKFAWVLIRSSVDSMREHAWSVLRGSYLATRHRTWLARCLMLQSEQELQTFLDEKGWKDQVDPADGAVLLKRAKVAT